MLTPSCSTLSGSPSARLQAAHIPTRRAASASDKMVGTTVQA